jgi:branched-chain amino acid transport system permease protein
MNQQHAILSYLYLLIAGVILVLISFPWWAPLFYLNLVIRILFFGIIVMGFSFLGGQLGLLSLMQSFFFGIAGYTVAILQVRYGILFPIPPLIALFAAILLAIFFGFFVLRTQGVYFLMLTMVIGQIGWVLSLQLTSITHGTTGIIGINAPGILHGSRITFYFVQLVIFLICIGFLVKITRSPFGLFLRGIRESESRMIMLGYPVFFIKLAAFVLSAALTAIGAIFYVYFYGVMNPDAISLAANVNIMLASILGGMGSLFGAILGSVIVKTLDMSLSAITARYMLVTGILFLIVIIFFPNGIVGGLGEVKFSSFRTIWQRVMQRETFQISKKQKDKYK